MRKNPHCLKFSEHRAVLNLSLPLTVDDWLMGSPTMVYSLYHAHRFSSILSAYERGATINNCTRKIIYLPREKMGIWINRSKECLILFSECRKENFFAWYGPNIIGR
jgi:hypothetical protein